MLQNIWHAVLEIISNLFVVISPYFSWTALGAISTFTAVLVALVIAVFGESLKAWWIGPNLRIEFNECPPDCHRTQFRDGTPVYYFRFRVINDGRSAAKQCEGVVELLSYFNSDSRLYEAERDFSHINLNWSSTFKDPELAGLRIFRTLNPRRIIHCDLGHIPAVGSAEQENPSWRNCSWFQEGDQKALKFFFDYAISPFSQIAYLRPGKYRLGIAIYAENARTVRKKFDIFWSGNWGDRQEQMFDEFSITDVTERE